MAFKISNNGKCKFDIKNLENSTTTLERRSLGGFPIPKTEEEVIEGKYYYIWFYFCKGVQAEIDRLTRKALNLPKTTLEAKYRKANQWKGDLLVEVREGKVFKTALRFLLPKEVIKLPSEERILEVAKESGMTPEQVTELLKKFMPRAKKANKK